MDVHTLDQGFNPWLAEEAAQGGDHLAMDSQSLRGSAHGTRTRPVHWLSGFLHGTGQGIGQGEVGEKPTGFTNSKPVWIPWRSRIG